MTKLREKFCRLSWFMVSRRSLWIDVGSIFILLTMSVVGPLIGPWFACSLLSLLCPDLVLSAERKESQLLDLEPLE